MVAIPGENESVFRFCCRHVLAVFSVVAVCAAGCSAPAPADLSTAENDSPLTRGALPAVEVELRDGQPTSGQPEMRALSCRMSDCPGKGEDGQPYLFYRVSPGRESHSRWPVATRRGGTLVCPACGRNDGIHHYDPPQAVERRKLLEKELRDSRAARRAAKQAGESMPTDHRTPAVIMQDLSNLPKVYLLQE